MDENKNSSGSLIGSIIVVLVLIIGAIYLFSNQVETPAPEAGTETDQEAALLGNSNTPGGASPNNELSLEAEAQAIANETARLDAELMELN